MDKQPHILCIDGMYMLHRARSGFKLGPAPVVFNFMRSFRALVEKFSPTRVYFVLEGHPKARHAEMPEYKANRLIEPGSPEEEDAKKFYSQVNVVVSLLSNNMPVSVVRHPDHECDDTIANLVRRSSSAIPWTIVTGDSDFIQLFEENKNVKLYNPVKKEYVVDPGYDYVTWKALKGDATDNIPGIPGIGPERATQMMNDPEYLIETLSVAENAAIFDRNYRLIKFVDWDDVEAFKMTSTSPTRNWDVVKSTFESYGFRSITEPKSWEKFMETFDCLWGCE